MQSDKGWICLHRDIREHWLWQDKPFSKGQSFADLLLLANHSDGKLLLGNELIFVKRGDLITSTVKLSEFWGWSRTKVTAFLKALEKDDMITIKSDNKKTAIHIVNYERYQGFINFLEQQKNSEETAENQHEDIKNATENQQKDCTQTSDKHQKSTNNNDNNDNNDNNKSNPLSPAKRGKASDDGFDKFWEAYPKKVARQDALRAWKKLKPDESLVSIILAALDNHKRSPQWCSDNGQYIPYPATWLNGKRWEDAEKQVQSDNCVASDENAHSYDLSKLVEHAMNTTPKIK